MLSKRKLNKMFSDFGLLNEDDREKLNSLSDDEIKKNKEEHIFIRMTSNTHNKEIKDAELE